MCKIFYIILFLAFRILLSAQDTLIRNQEQDFSNYKGLSSYSESMEQNIKRQHAFAIAGIPCFAAGLVMLAGSFTISTANSANGDNNLARTGAMIGGTFIITGLTFEIISIANGIKKKKRLKKTSNYFNLIIKRN